MENKEELTADQVIQEISEVLAEADGNTIAQIANSVLSQPIEYDGDSIFSRVTDTN